MTIKEIVSKLNDLASHNKRPFSKLQEIRSKNGINPRTWSPFAAFSIKEDYAFHAGGRKEFQFNIGQDWIKSIDVFRYGLAFSLNQDRTLHNSKAEFRPKIERFNNLILNNPSYFYGYSMWYYINGEFGKFYNTVQPIDSDLFQAENFIFIGKFLEKGVETVNANDINIILDAFDYLITAYEDVEFGKTKIEKRIARLTWNKNGWVKPSGPDGKSKNKDTHEGKFGYGHEEWLFDTSKLIDGYHYGFLEPIRKQQHAYTNNIYDVWLYTIDNISKKRFWVGEISKVEVINNIMAERIKEIYIQNNWHNEMEFQIVDCGANADGFSDWNGVDLFNVRFLPTEIKFSDYCELPKENRIYEQSRYTFANYNENLTPPKVTKGFTFRPDDSETSGSSKEGDGKIGKSTYDRAPRAIEVNYVHKAISDGLSKKLKTLYGIKNVKAENSAGYRNNKIDIVVKNDAEYVFYEIKAYVSTKTSIREAIGQLLEYSYWVNNDNANKLVIVTQALGDIEDAKNYTKHLRDMFRIPIYFQTFDLSSKELSEEY